MVAPHRKAGRVISERNAGGYLAHWPQQEGKTKKWIGVVHCVAKCLDCDKEFDSHKNGQALAAQHAKKYKHVVTGEVGLVFKYDGKSGG